MKIKRIRKTQRDRIVIEDEFLGDYVDYIQKNNIKKIQINELYYKKDHVDFLEKCPELEDINISSIHIKDIESIYKLKSLRKLGIHVPNISLDLSKLQELDELDLEWNKNIKGLESCSNLRKLFLLQYKPINKNLEELQGLVKLRNLTLTQSNILSFQGVSSLVELKTLELNYLRNILQLDELEQNAESMEVLSIQSCKKISNWDSLIKQKKLKQISLANCGKIPSVHFTYQLTNLSTFIFMETLVEDGDLTPLLKLDYVAFNDKKHYSHKSSDFNKVIEER